MAMTRVDLEGIVRKGCRCGRPTISRYQHQRLCIVEGFDQLLYNAPPSFSGPDANGKEEE